jgi:hypothetical protein
MGPWALAMERYIGLYNVPGMGAEVILVLVEDCEDDRQEVGRGTAVPPLALSIVSRYGGVYGDAAADARAEVVYCNGTGNLCQGRHQWDSLLPRSHKFAAVTARGFV